MRCDLQLLAIDLRFYALRFNRPIVRTAMSFPYAQDARRRRLGAGAGFSPSGRRTFMGYWVPLAVTVGIATAGVAAWIWSERSDEEEENNEDQHGDGPRDDDHGETNDGFSTRGPPGTEEEELDLDDAGMVARMHNTLRRTPSPQQIFDGASKRVAAGVAAAGAFVGGLASIREENRGDFEDHSRWSEEMQSRASEREEADIPPTMSGALPTRLTAGAPFDKKKRSVAIVVSSVSSQHGPEDSNLEHAVGYKLYSSN